MTNRLKVKDEEDEVVSDWKFAAMVIDRYSRDSETIHWLHYLQILPDNLHNFHGRHHSNSSAVGSSRLSGITAAARWCCVRA